MRSVRTVLATDDLTGQLVGRIAEIRKRPRFDGSALPSRFLTGVRATGGLWFRPFAAAQFGDRGGAPPQQGAHQFQRARSQDDRMLAGDLAGAVQQGRIL